MNYTKGLWAQGKTLHATTKISTKEECECNESIEKRSVYANVLEGDAGQSKTLIANCLSEEDAERIVACLNACNGITTEALRGAIVLYGIQAIMELNESRPHPFCNGVPPTNPTTFDGAVVWEKDNLEKK